MLIRFWHFMFARHKWEEFSRTIVGGTGQVYSNMSEEYHRLVTYGFTEINYTCHCGASRRVRLLGARNVQADKEVQQLRKLMEQE